MKALHTKVIDFLLAFAALAANAPAAVVLSYTSRQASHKSAAAVLNE